MNMLQRGARGKLSQYGQENQPWSLMLKTDGPAEYDCTCFGLNTAGKLAGDDWMIFYNQMASPGAEIKMSNVLGGARFDLDLSRVPANIDKLAFTISIDGAGVMSGVKSLTADLIQGGAVVASCNLTGQDFSSETAVIAFEIYRKPDWRVSAVMRGFNGGLSDLLRHYGGEEDSNASVSAGNNTAGAASAQGGMTAGAQAAKPAGTHKIDLEKKLEKAPALINLAKPLKISLEKHKLQDEIARVALVMDISGSMTGRYRNGTVQSVVNKTLPLAVQFDDDGNLDFWYYGNRCQKMPDVTLDNYTGAVPADWSSLMHKLGGGNSEPVVMREVMDFYDGTDLPVYILFVTDGGVGSEHKISKLLIEASEKPLFWQFVGVGGHNYGVLERLDRMDGRYVDNAGFFALDDFKTVPDKELYDRLLDEFPQWLQAVRQKGMIR